MSGTPAPKCKTTKRCPLFQCGEVKVYGKVEGKITSERCELKDKSRINGDIKSKVFSMEEGASLSGRTEIGG